MRLRAVFYASAVGLLSIIHPAASPAAEWDVVCEGTTGNATVWGSSPGNIYSVGSRGWILHYDGSTWTRMTSGTTTSLYGIWGTAENDVFVVGDNGTILHYDGYAWSSMISGTTTSLYGIWGTAANDVFAVGASGTILHYDGLGWSKMTSAATSDLHEIQGSSSSNVYTISGNRVLHYDGTAWSYISPTLGPVQAVWGTSSVDVLVVGAAGTILHYDGSVWTPMTSGTANDLSGIWGNSSNDVYVVGGNGTILHYDGSSWAPIASGTSDYLVGFWGSSPTQVYSARSALFYFRYRDGSTWANGPPTCPSLRAIWGGSATNVLAVYGGILQYDGGTWSVMPSTPCTGISRVWGSSLIDIFGIGSSPGYICHYDGKVWSKIFSSSSDWFSGIWGSSPNDVFAVGDDGTHGLIRHYNGSAWSPMLYPTKTTRGITFSGVWGSIGTDVYAIGYGGVIWHYNGSGWSAANSSTTADLYSIWGSAWNDIFAVGIGGTVLHFDGSNWAAMNSGTTMDLFGIWGSSATDVYAVGKFGTILHYDGSSWSSAVSGTTNSLSAIWGSSSLDVFAVGENVILQTRTPPVAQDDSFITEQSSSMEVASPGVLMNDTDAARHPLITELVSGTSHGTVNLRADGGFNFTPMSGYVGQDSFVYKAYDGESYSGNAVVTITVKQPNIPPVAESQTIAAIENTAVNITLHATDGNGDTLTYTIIAPPAHGTLSGSVPSVTYKSVARYSGSDTFSFKANDGQTDSNVATVTISVSRQITLSAALDLKKVWLTGGSKPWFGQTRVRHDGVDAAQSGFLGNRQSNWLKATVVGPKTISFWWRTASAPGDELRFFVDSKRMATRGGTTGWQKKSFQIGTGTHVVKWTFSRSATGSAGMNAGFVDQVRITAP